MPKLDPTSAEPVLYYVGPRIVAGVPADDLSANTLARLAWVRGGQKGTPLDIKDEAIVALRDVLIATGNYADKSPATPANTGGKA